MKAFSYAALLIAAVITVFSMLKSAAGNFDLGTLVFMAWAVSPYLMVLIVSALLARFASPPKLSLVTGVVATLMLAVTAVIYLGSLDGSSSTEALIFVFLPLYLLVGGLGTFGVGLGISWLAVRTRR